MTFSDELLITLQAHKGSFASVRSHVSLQVSCL